MEKEKLISIVISVIKTINSNKLSPTLFFERLSLSKEKENKVSKSEKTLKIVEQQKILPLEASEKANFKSSWK